MSIRQLEIDVPRYIALIDGQPGGFGVVFPDCPGCTAMGDTMDEAVASAASALREWAELRAGKGFPPPAARFLHDLREDPEVIEAVRKGAIIASVSSPTRRHPRPERS